jgi:hypothetical protein
MVVTAAANVAVSAHHAVKVGEMQKRFGKKLDSDEAKKQYIKFIIERFQSLGTRLAKGGRYRPGTDAFELILKKALLDDMNYHGYCKTDIFVPHTPGDKPKATRTVYASIDRIGHVSRGKVPPDVGPIWATGCKNADDFFRMAYIEGIKGKRKHRFFKFFKEDIGTMDLFLRFGTGLLLAIVMLAMIKIQRAVVAEQVPLPRKKRKKRKKKKKKPDSS